VRISHLNKCLKIKLFEKAKTELNLDTFLALFFSFLNKNDVPNEDTSSCDLP